MQCNKVRLTRKFVGGLHESVSYCNSGYYDALIMLLKSSNVKPQFNEVDMTH